MSISAHTYIGIDYGFGGSGSQSPTDPLGEYATRTVLLDLGADPAQIDRLPIRHTTPDGDPYWPADEIVDLLATTGTGGVA